MNSQKTNNNAKRKVILDIEANALRNVTDIWCICCVDVSTKELFKFYPKKPFTNHKGFMDEFLKFIDKEVDTIIGHNIVGYDIPTLKHVFGKRWKFPFEKLVDTLILSRLFKPVTPFNYESLPPHIDNRIGGHSLDAWGKRLGFAKIQFDDFSRFTDEMLTYCVNDCYLNLKVYNKLLEEGKGFSSLSIEIEHKVARLLKKQEDNGFKLDKDKAVALKEVTEKLQKELFDELQVQFPPIPKLYRNMVPKVTKNGEVSKVTLNSLERCDTYKLKEDGTYDLFFYEVFNPKSPKQVGERLLSLGWKPSKKTPSGAPATDKKSIELAIKSLVDKHPSVKPLEHYNIVVNRLEKVTKWLELCEDRCDGKVHGRVNPIGAGTHRCSHYDDNMANIPSVKKDKDGKILLGLEGGFGWECRDCWTVTDKDKHILVGADASGIQLRALAHYMDDPDYTKVLLEGDIHTVNQLAAGIGTRASAKTFIYAFLLGAGDYKTGTIVGLRDDEIDELLSWADDTEYFNSGKTIAYAMKQKLKREKERVTRHAVALMAKGFRVKNQFLDRTPALKRLRTKDIPEVTKQGYLIGLDGRKLWIPNEHLALSVYLQSFEAIIMKYAMVLYSEELISKRIPFRQVAMVHDEIQIETLKEYGDVVGKAVVDAIKKAGELLSSNCPLDGEYKLGLSWADTH